MQNNCPVCNKVGIADFTTQHVVCPQCNSDLKPYLLLSSISNSKSKNISHLTLGIVSFIILVLSILYLNTLSKNKDLAINNSKLALQLQDTIINLKANIASKSKKLDAAETKVKETIVHYTVKEGDYPSKIAEFFFDDWRMYKQIEIDNNLSQPYILKVGQQLSIKLKTE